MNRIIKIGMDVHSKNYTLCAMEPTIGAEDRIYGEVQVAPDYKEVICFIESLKMKLGFYDDYSIECGYEAGCLGYTLYHQLTGAGIKCVILAPTTMLTQQGKRIKTDKRDARLIAQCLCYGGYHPVYIPTGEDDAVKEYLRMRDDHKLALKKLKQQINAFLLRHGHLYSGTKWTIKHVNWLKKLELDPMYRETLNEYMASYEEQEAKSSVTIRGSKKLPPKHVIRKMRKSLAAFWAFVRIQHCPCLWKPVILSVLLREIPMQYSWGWHLENVPVQIM